MRSIRWGLATIATLIAEFMMIAVSIIVVAVYSYAIHTGETQEFYSAFARVSGPWVSLVAGGPVFYLIGRWIKRRAPEVARETAMAMCGLYLAIEIAVLLLWPGEASALLSMLPFLLVAFVPKLIGAWSGAGGQAARASAGVA